MPELTTAPVRPTMSPASDHDGSIALRGSVAEGLALAVAPTTGRFQPDVAVGDASDHGSVLGHITGGRGRADAVHAPTAGRLLGLLVAPGQLVRRGDALAWLDRGVASTPVVLPA